jgi:hypothetical protein
MQSSNDGLYISDLYIKPEFRGCGIGSKIMRDITNFADKNDINIVLIPEPESLKKVAVKRLVDFYKKFGFVLNTGKNKDYKLSDTFATNMYRYPKSSLNEDVTSSADDWNQETPLNSVKEINSSVKKELVAAAQKVYDEWQQDNNGHDEELGSGGICHLIADDLLNVLSNHKIYNCQSVCSNYEQHVYIIGKFEEGVYEIDIPYSIYETGGGFNWKKIPDVVFDGSHISISRLDGDPDNFDNYVDNT